MSVVTMWHTEHTAQEVKFTFIHVLCSSNDLLQISDCLRNQRHLAFLLGCCRFRQSFDEMNRWKSLCPVAICPITTLMSSCTIIRLLRITVRLWKQSLVCSLLGCNCFYINFYEAILQEIWDDWWRNGALQPIRPFLHQRVTQQTSGGHGRGHMRRLRGEESPTCWSSVPDVLQGETYTWTCSNTNKPVMRSWTWHNSVQNIYLCT